MLKQLCGEKSKAVRSLASHPRGTPRPEQQRWSQSSALSEPPKMVKMNTLQDCSARQIEVYKYMKGDCPGFYWDRV